MTDKPDIPDIAPATVAHNENLRDRIAYALAQADGDEPGMEPASCDYEMADAVIRDIPELQARCDCQTKNWAAADEGQNELNFDLRTRIITALLSEDDVALMADAVIAELGLEPEPDDQATQSIRNSLYTNNIQDWK